MDLPRRHPGLSLRGEHSWAPALVLVLPMAVGLALWAVLRQPFDPVRLLVKSLVPVAAVLPAVLLLPPGPFRATTAAAFSLSAMLAATAACLSVFGVSLEPAILGPLLGLTAPPVVPLAVALMLLTLSLLRPGRARHAGSVVPSPTDLLSSAGEAVYFGGFLLASTHSLGGWSWALVGLGQIAAARARGVPAARALGGSIAMIAVTLWSGNSYVAFLTHLALLRSGGELRMRRGGLSRWPGAPLRSAAHAGSGGAPKLATAARSHTERVLPA